MEQQFEKSGFSWVYVEFKFLKSYLGKLLENLTNTIQSFQRLAFPGYRSQLQSQFEKTETTENLENLISVANKLVGVIFMGLN